MPGNDAFKWWLEPLSSDKPSARLLWEIAPWRSAWLAAEWPRLESTLACQAYAHLSFKSVEMARTDSTAFALLCKHWKSVRHHSSIASSVDLIRTWPLLGTKVVKLVQVWHGRSFIRSIRNRLPLNCVLFCQKKRRSMTEQDERRLQNLVLAFFDARKSGAADSPSGDAPDYVANATTRWKSLAHSAHLSLYAQVPLYSSSTIDPWVKPKSLSKLSLKRHTENLPECLREVIGIYALDRVFQQNGCLVHVWPKTSATATDSQQRQAAFWNLSSHQSVCLKATWRRSWGACKIAW